MRLGCYQVYRFKWRHLHGKLQTSAIFSVLFQKWSLHKTIWEKKRENNVVIVRITKWNTFNIKFNQEESAVQFYKIYHGSPSENTKPCMNACCMWNIPTVPYFIQVVFLTENPVAFRWWIL